jgi:hypothetical protein
MLGRTNGPRERRAWVIVEHMGNAYLVVVVAGENATLTLAEICACLRVELIPNVFHISLLSCWCWVLVFHGAYDWLLLDVVECVLTLRNHMTALHGTMPKQRLLRRSTSIYSCTRSTANYDIEYSIWVHR